ncbi:MOSC domain-containing protein [Candidatus Woesearchaeota archaeon]|nr:MOSC domain-containing protein [Candidatus Woesearchaeota archaeon]
MSKIPVKKATLKVNHGIVGDAHAAPGDRQVSLLAKESHDKFQPYVEKCLRNGIFGENITTNGVLLTNLKIGDELIIKDVVLEVSKIGKECHAPCDIGKSVGRCIMPEEGIFAKVTKPGVISVGDEIKTKTKK